MVRMDMRAWSLTVGLAMAGVCANGCVVVDDGEDEDFEPALEVGAIDEPSHLESIQEVYAGSVQRRPPAHAVGAPAVGVAAIMACDSAEDCNDGNPCTLDYCQVDGSCYNPDDTQHLSCGEEGRCWEGSCCEGCFDMTAGACVAECPAGKTCGALGACL